MLAQQRKVKMERESMKILSVNHGYNNKAQKTNQSKTNTNFGAVLVKSNFELFEGRKSLAEKLFGGIGFSYPTKLSALANRTRGNSKNIVAQPFTFEAKNPTRFQEVYLSDGQERKLDEALVAVGKELENNYNQQVAAGRSFGDLEHRGIIINRLWEQPAGPMRTLRNLVEEFFTEAEKNPIEHVVTACAARLKKANEKVGDAQQAINVDLHAALNGRKFPEQLELPFPQEKLKRRIRFGLGGMLDDFGSFRHPWDRG